MKNKMGLMKVATGIMSGFGFFLLVLLLSFTAGEAASGGPDEFSLLVSQLVQDEWDDSFFDNISLRIGDEYMYVDGEQIRIGGRHDVPIIVQGEAMLPIMEIADFAGAYVDFDMREQRLTIETDEAYVDSTGEVWGVRPGTATITVRTVDGNRTATATVTVISRL